MTKIDPLQASFNAGELSPRLHARVDFVKYPSGLEECQNLIPLPEGGVTRRPGTRFVAEIADSTKKGRLFGFEATAEQHHVLELGENKIRFYFRQGQQVVLATDAVITNGLFSSDISDWDDRSTGGAGNQISHDATNDRLTLETSGTASDDISWAEQDITTTDLDQEHVIKFEVIGDPGDKIEFQVGSSTTGSEILSPVEKLVGYHCVAFTPTASPFYIQFRNLGSNADKDVQIDNVSIIDDSALEIDSPYIEAQLFQIAGAQSNDVKYLFRSGVAPYKLERRTLASWSLVRVVWQDGPYITQNAEITTLTPAATSGVAVAVTASSIIGINGGQGFLSTDVGRLVRIDNGAFWGWGIIVAITSTLIVDVHVKKAFAATSGTADWRLGAWSDTTGWPKTGGFFEQRLYVASTDDQSQTLWGSQTGDFENFKPDDDTGTVEDDDALDFTLSADNVNEIRWLSAGEDTLAIGTAGGEWVPSASGIVITPLDITIRRQTTHGSSLVAPLRVDHVVLFVQKAKRKIREFVFNFEFDSYLAPDITRLAQHITAPGIDAMAFQQEPDSLVWVIRSDGVMPSLTFRRDEDVVGWARHIIGGMGSTGAEVSFTITGGSRSVGTNSITSIDIGGVELLDQNDSVVDWVTSNAATAVSLAAVINGDPCDLHTLFYDNVSLDVSGLSITDIQSVAFSADGLTMYVGGDDNGTVAGVFQFALSTAGDILMAVDSGISLSTFSEDSNVSGLFVSPDGTKIFVGGGGADRINRYDLSTPGLSSSGVYAGPGFFTGGTAAAPYFTFNRTGTKMYVSSSSGPDDLNQFTLSPAWNTLAGEPTFDGAALFTHSGGPMTVDSMFFSLDGMKLFVIDRFNNGIYEYDLVSVENIIDMTYSGKSFDLSSQDGETTGLVSSGDCTKVYVTGDDTDSIYQYSFGPTNSIYTAFVSGATVTIKTGTAFIGGGEAVAVTATGDVEIDGNTGQTTFTLASTGVSFSESVVTIDGFDGTGQVQNSEDRDEVWVTVQRTINGEAKRYVEFVEGYYDNLLHDQEDAYYVDSMITYDGVSTTIITGLDHLEGETVKVWGDGAILPNVVVANGQITLSTAVEVAQIGLAYKHRLKTLKIEGGNPAGTAMGKKKRINGITFVLLNSHTLIFGPNDDNLFETDFRLVSDPMDAGAPLFTGEQFREFDGGLTTDARIIIESDDPAPFTLLAMVPEIVVIPSK